MTSPPESARVVVVGAGIAGASVAHHLAERGWDEIVVVDQGPLFQTGGSTSHAPGLVFQHNASRTMTRLAQWTVEQLTALGRLPPGGQHRGRHDRRALGRARPPLGAGARLRPRGARCSTPREVAELLPLLDPATILGGLHVADDGIAKAVRAAQALCRPRGDRGVRRLRGHRPADRGRPRGRRADRARHDPRRARRHRRAASGAASVSRAGAGAQRAARAGRAPARLHRAAARARGGDARGRAPDPAPPGPRDVLPPGRRRLRDRQLPPRAAPGRSRAPGGAGLHPRRLRRGARRGGPAAAGAARRRDRARLQRPDVVHARRLPAAGRERRGARAVAGPGDLGHALGRLRARAGRAHDPRRRPARPPRVRPAALRRPRDEHDLRAPARRAGLPRGLRRPAPAPAERAGARAAHDAVLRAPAAPRRASSSRAPAGSARSGTRPTASC